MDEEQVHFFGNICGSPPTYKRLLKQSSLPFLDEDQSDEHETYDDHCSCGRDSEQVHQHRKPIIGLSFKTKS
jgi:hypothetical protein